MRALYRTLGRLPRPLRAGIDLLLTVVVAGVLILLVEAEVAQPFRIPSSSMEPTLHCARPAAGCEASFSDRVIACRICFRLGSPSRGQIVVFRTPPAAAARCGEGGTFVKRLVGLPNETIREDAKGFLWVDGRRLAEPYVTAASRAGDPHRGESWRVPEGEYFFAGDNRDGSCDSRDWGSVPRGDLIGPVVARYWPPQRLDVGSAFG